MVVLVISLVAARGRVLPRSLIKHRIATVREVLLMHGSAKALVRLD